jgi:hypothetical protein
MANPTVTYTFVNGNVADASQVNQNFTDVINSLTDGSKSLNIDAITAAGAATLNSNVTLGNAVGDAITVNGAFAGTGGDASATQKGLVTTSTQTFAGDKTFSGSITPSGGIVGKTDGAAVGAGKVGQNSFDVTGLTSSAGSAWQNSGAQVVLKKGVYSLTGSVEFNLNGSTMQSISVAISTYSGATTTDHVPAKNTSAGPPPTAPANATLTVADYVVTITVDDTTVYLKAFPEASAGTPRMYSCLKYRRIA